MLWNLAQNVEFFVISQKKTYIISTHQKHLNEVFLKSTYNKMTQSSGYAFLSFFHSFFFYKKKKKKKNVDFFLILKKKYMFGCSLEVPQFFLFLKGNIYYGNSPETPKRGSFKDGVVG